jgi:membrane associated rhomboid family serine protease
MATQPRYCYRHPDRETGLSCSECGRPICYECMTPAAVGLRCPEHSGKPQGIQRVTNVVTRPTTGIGSRRTNLVTLILIGINFAVYLSELAIGGTVDGTGNWIYDHGVLLANGVWQNGQLYQVPAGTAAAVGNAGVQHGEWWRLVTAAFLHYGPIHIALNMFSLYYAGSILETAIGRWRFLLLYMVSGVAGSAGAIFWSPNSLTVGASGAIFGVLGGLLVLERRGHLATGGQVLGLIVLNLLFTFAVPGISRGGHIGGLIAGILVMVAFDRFRRSPGLCVASAALVTIASLVLAYSSI